MSLPSSEQPLPNQREIITYPEDKENFTGQSVLVIGGPDAHGVSMAVTSAQYLESKGSKAKIYVGSPVIREGKGATHSGAFYSKTLPELDIEGYDRVVVADIPLDFRQLFKKYIADWREVLYRFGWEKFGCMGGVSRSPR